LETNTTVSRLTSLAPSAISVIEVAGPRALEWVQRCWQPHAGSSALSLNRIRFGSTRCNGQSQGESVVVCRTDEQRIEIHCHGGRLASEHLIRELVSYGATQRSTSDTFEALGLEDCGREALEDLVKANTMTNTAILMDQWRGALTREFQSIERLLQDNRSREEAMKRLSVLQERFSIGCHLIAPWRIVLAGPPNVGKSSLLNRLLGYSRAIVHEQAGTTRDLLAEQTSIEGWPMQFIDSAGVRARKEVSDEIEATGVAKTLECIATADCMLLLVDSVVGWTQVHEQLISDYSGKCILVKTKSDLIDDGSANEQQAMMHSRGDSPLEFSEATGVKLDRVVNTSCLTGAGLQELMSAIVHVLISIPLQPGDAVPFRKRHADWIATKLNETLTSIG
jgi:tRNA modification GTPase